MHVSIVKVNVSRRLICHSKSPIWTDEWLKGFWNRSSYAQDIGCQSSNTNPDSPCSFPDGQTHLPNMIRVTAYKVDFLWDKWVLFILKGNRL